LAVRPFGLERREGLERLPFGELGAVDGFLRLANALA
jgi:hypothetical protein